jgi:hypothetical protein
MSDRHHPQVSECGTSRMILWQASGMRRGALLVVVALALVGIEGCTGVANRACGLLTSRDIAGVLGSPPAGHSGSVGGVTQSCQYHGPTFVLLNVEVVEGAPMPAASDAVAVASLGHQAEAVGQALYVNSGNRVLVVGLDMASVTLQHARELQIALARIALSHL